MVAGNINGDDDTFIFALAIAIDLATEQDRDVILRNLKGVLKIDTIFFANKVYCIVQGLS